MQTSFDFYIPDRAWIQMITVSSSRFAALEERCGWWWRQPIGYRFTLPRDIECGFKIWMHSAGLMWVSPPTPPQHYIFRIGLNIYQAVLSAKFFNGRIFISTWMIVGLIKKLKEILMAFDRLFMIHYVVYFFFSICIRSGATDATLIATLLNNYF